MVVIAVGRSLGNLPTHRGQHRVPVWLRLGEVARLQRPAVVGEHQPTTPDELPPQVLGNDFEVVHERPATVTSASSARSMLRWLAALRRTISHTASVSRLFLPEMPVSTPSRIERSQSSTTPCSARSRGAGSRSSAGP